MGSCRALVTGIGGQDGSLLAELLFERGYDVIGTVRPERTAPHETLEAIQERIEVVPVDLLDPVAVIDLFSSCRPHEVYHLASVSFVPASWDEPVATARFAAVSATALLEAIRRVDPETRFFQASSAEIFGDPQESPQTERTPVLPLTPYGAAKAYAFFVTRAYRLRYGLHASSGILYNHESPRRPLDFVTRKITLAAAAIKLGLERELALGNLDARRDWGYAGDYVRAMWLMLQADESDDYVVATGVAHSVRELVALAFERVGLDWREQVRVDASLQRGNADAPTLVGDATRARERLGWEPRVSFEELVSLMVDADLARLGAKRVGPRASGE